MSFVVGYAVSNVPQASRGFSATEVEFANQVALQAYNMNCKEVHIDSPSRVGDSVYTVGAGGSYPIDVHFHGKKQNTQYRINNSTVTFVMAPQIRTPPAGNSFSSYGIKFKR